MRGRKLFYRGGAVVTGQPKVYLVFWGSQWGTQGTSGGYQVFTGDPFGLAPNLQAFFTGIGTNNELWSAIAGQYCQGVGAGTVSCPVSAPHVSYPNADVLAGVWEDTTYTPPTGPPTDPSTPGVTGAQLGQETANAAAHFSDSSANAQYVIVSPTGTNPDGWSDPTGGFCAYHSSTTGVGLGGPEVAFTNLPYLPDAGSSCGAGSVNSPGTLDGVTLTAGHEYVETLTDPFATAAWLDARGQEIGDKCESLSAGGPGGLYNLSLTTGTFAVQGMWANDANNGHGGCVDVHTPVLVSNPGKQASVVGTGVSLQINAIDLLVGPTLTYSTSGLPVGLSINSTSGLISGTPGAHGRVLTTVVVSDGSHTASTGFKWTVKRH